MDNKKIELLKAQFSAEFKPILKEISNRERHKFYSAVSHFLHTYATGYELGRDIVLVLDNNIVQDFKHQSIPHRGLRAQAYIAFCRFVGRWSDRPTSLGVSPVILYEHNGRRPSTSPENAMACYLEVQKILHGCDLPVAMLGFTDGRPLHAAMKNIHIDADYLEVFAAQIKISEWERDLQAPYGGEIIAAAVAASVIPDDMPLKYFNPYYIRRVFGSRIEQMIADQSKGIFHSSPIRSGPVSSILATLNTFTKKGVFQGLGDIELLQICDVGRQYHHDIDPLLLGQTYDRDLEEALRLHHCLVKGKEAIGGARNFDKQVTDMVQFMFSNPYTEEEERLKRILLKMQEFAEHVAEICIELGPRGA